MEPFKNIEKYCDTVCEQIRWKKARPEVATEIKNHLCDQRDAYILESCDEIEATEKAILQMGDPILIGEELDKTHKPKAQWGMLALVVILIMIGFVINYFSTSQPNSIFNFKIYPYILAIILLITSYFADFRIFSKNPKLIYFTTIVISFFGLLFNGNEINGSTVWYIGFQSLSILNLYLFYPLVFAVFIYSMRKKGVIGVLFCGLAYLPFAIILLLSSITTLITYTFICLTILIFAVTKGWFDCDKKLAIFLILIPTFIVSLAICIGLFNGYTSGFRGNRIQALVDPYSIYNDAGFINVVSRELLKGAVLFGEGQVNESISNIKDFSFLYNNEYILTYAIHKLGLFILFLIIMLISVFTYIGIKNAIKERSMLGALVALSIILTFVVQCIIYILGNLGYGLLTPITLPFISHGNTALCINAILIGFMLSVFRTGDLFSDYTKLTRKNNKGTKGIILEDGRLIINFK